PAWLQRANAMASDQSPACRARQRPIYTTTPSPRIVIFITYGRIAVQLPRGVEKQRLFDTDHVSVNAAVRLGPFAVSDRPGHRASPASWRPIPAPIKRLESSTYPWTLRPGSPTE